MDRWLEGRVALITGGASGIGEAVARRFVAEGAKVGVLDLAADKLRALAKELGSAMTGVEGDVRRLEDNRRAVRTVAETFGGLDVLVANAGVFDGFVGLAELPEDAVDEAFEEIFSVNVKGYLLGVKAALSELQKREGAIIFTGSSAGLYAGGGGPIYTASKHAVVGLTRQLAYELAPRVRVNCVAPGGTLTDLNTVPSLSTVSRFVQDHQARAEIIKGRNPLQIAMAPEDHVAAYVLLASDQARAMTGVIISSDGGLGVRASSSG